MKWGQIQSSNPVQIVRNLIAIVCAMVMLPGNSVSWEMQQQQQQQQPQQQPQQQQPQAAGSTGQDTKLADNQIDSLVAPIALYPDPLLSQTLVASTYPLEIVQLHQWLQQNKNLKGKELTAAVEKQKWDPSVQAMAPFPDVVKQMAENVGWTNDLGNAFLAQQNDVMNAVQRMRTKAMEKGALKSTEQQKVETKVVEDKTVVVVEPTSTEVVYVPTYNPVTVWGSPYYPYPAIAYPAYPVGGMMLSFGVGVAMGAAWGGGWGWNTGWGGNNDITINRQNNFVSNYNRTNAGGRYGGANNQWRHNPQHRGGAPYGDRATANRYGGAARGDNLGQRQTAARQNTARQQGQFGGSSFRGDTNRGNGARGNSNLGGSAQGLNRSAAGGGGDRIGNREVSSGSMGSRSNSAFSGDSGRSSARASSARGASSMGGSRGGGSRGGGGRRR